MERAYQHSARGGNPRSFRTQVPRALYAQSRGGIVARALTQRQCSELQARTAGRDAGAPSRDAHSTRNSAAEIEGGLRREVRVGGMFLMWLLGVPVGLLILLYILGVGR